MAQQTPIQFNIERTNMNNVELRAEKLKSASALRAGMTFVDPLGNEIVVPPSPSGVPFDILRYIESKATAENGIKRDARAKDYVAQFEKEFAAILKKPGPDGSKFTSDLRQGDLNYQWDSYTVSVTPEVGPEEWETIKKIAIERFRTTAAHDKYVLDPDGEVVPFTGVNGKRALFYSEEHDNTGHRHFHVIANRIAFDMEAKEIATAINWSKRGNFDKGFADIKRALQENGINYATFTTGAGKDSTNNELDMLAQEKTNEQLVEAGGQGINPSRRVVVEVPLGNGETTFMAAPLTVSEESLQRRQGLVQSELEHLNKEIVRMQEQAKAKALEATVIEQAISAVASHNLLSANLKVAEERLVQAAGDYQALQSVADTVTQERDQAQQAHQALHDSMVNIGADLADAGKVLGLDDSQKESLQSGDPESIGTLVGNLGAKVSGLNEALDNFPEDLAEVANQMRDDPFEGVNALLDQLLESRKQTATLMTERDGLRSDLAKSTDLNTELQKQIGAVQSDLEDIKAKMARREEEFERQMAEQVQLVRNAQSDVARAEGKVSAKQEQLDEEKAKVEKLTRTKDAVMDLMTSDNPGQAWETTKNYLQDDAFANRAMGAYLRTVSELEQAQQRIATMQKELVDLGQVRENLVAAQATIEEQLGRVNDGGVADLRALNEQNKKLQADNETLQAQVRDLADAADEAQKARPVDNAALEAEQQEAVFAREETRRANAEIERLKAALAKAESQASQAPDLDPKLQKALDLMQGNPEWAAVIEEATDNPSLREIILEFTRQSDQQTGMQPAQGATDQGTDYTKGLTRDNDGPKQDDPDQSNKQ